MSIKHSFAVFWHKWRLHILTAGLLSTLFIVFFWNDMVVSVHSGELGVKYHRLGDGTDLSAPYGEGTHLIWPFDILYVYDVRILEHTEDVVMLTQSGLPVTVSISCKFQLDRNSLPIFHQQVGPDYLKKIIIPMINSVARQMLGAYTSDELYSAARQELEDALMVSALSSVGRLPITIQSFAIKNITLPPKVEGAIIDKAVAEQRYRRYEFLLLEEAEEAKRKHLEAVGIKNFQDIVNAGMTENFLRYQGVIATQELAASQNAKIVIAGGGKDGLPVILNTQDTPLPQPAPEQGNFAQPESAAPKAATPDGPQQNTAPLAPTEPDPKVLPAAAQGQQEQKEQKEQEEGRLKKLTNAINDILQQRIVPPALSSPPPLQGGR